MIWIRRVMVVPLILLFVVVFVATLVITQVDQTAADPDFYNDQMHRSDVYSFLYEEALPSALDEIEEENDPSDVPIHLAKVKTEAISTVKKSLPPEWVESQFESATETYLPYFLGETDQFSYTFDLKQRALDAAEALKDFLHGEAFESVYDDLMVYLAGKVVENLDQLPYDLPLTTDQIKAAFVAVLPADWISRQVTPAIDSSTPYFVGDSDGFIVTVEVDDRIDPTVEQLLNLFGAEETYGHLFDEMVVPVIEETIGLRVDLGLGVSLSRSDIVSAIETALAYGWIEQRFEDVVYGIAAFVKGETETFDMIVDLEEGKTLAVEILAQMVKDRVGPSYMQLERSMGVTVEAVVTQFVIDPLPDRWTYTEADLRCTMGSENEGILDDARDWVQHGWTYTDVDLKGDLDSDEQDTLEDVRGWIADGYTLTEDDLRDEMTEGELADFDDARGGIDTFRSWLWLLGLLPFGLLVGIGFLGGRGWWGRVYWALSVLFVVSLVVYLAVTVAYSHVGESEIEDAFGVSDYNGLEQVLLQKGEELALNASGGFVDGMKTDTLWLCIFSGVILVGVTAFSVIRSRRYRWPRVNREGQGDDFVPFRLD